MRYREPWSLFRRRFTPDGLAVWYYRTYDEHGRRTTAQTADTTSKTLASEQCARLYRGRNSKTATAIPYGSAGSSICGGDTHKGAANMGILLGRDIL